MGCRHSVGSRPGLGVRPRIVARLSTLDRKSDRNAGHFWDASTALRDGQELVEVKGGGQSQLKVFFRRPAIVRPTPPRISAAAISSRVDITSDNSATPPKAAI